jgi:hypothetical protein
MEFTGLQKAKLCALAVPPIGWNYTPPQDQSDYLQTGIKAP